ncbi:DEAD-box ATP-dependent RNA helicase 50 isoform X2 [Cryptomeria japonica]|uniref:DEAD-box ATP-dependent RNA helicase 50 isoform X2 n=1 Tax=Cryptomeria japonica TaxID=3369 RepID=UPI0025AD92FD|nr:DEAD-box ATP-dependent RNA helicase 50 isoform X2 [Cryptomeria japonica]
MQNVVLANVQIIFPSIAQNDSKILQKDARLNGKTSLASRQIISSRNNGLTPVKRLRMIATGSTEKKKILVVNDSESSAKVLRAKKGGLYATVPKHEMHRSSKSDLETQKIYREGKKFEESTSNKIKPLLRREGTNIDSTCKDISKTKNNHGRWGKFVEYSPQGKPKTLNASKEGSKFGSANDFFSLRTFKDLGASEDMLQALKTQGILRPSHIQVLNACRAISRAGMPFRSMVATGGFKWKTQRENLEQGTDILIATPGRFCFLLQEGELQPSNLLSMVLDEVDILFDDEDFAIALETLTSSAPLAAQYLFVTATLPLDVHNKIVERFPDCKAILGPGLHRTCSGLEEILIDCSGEGEEKNPETAFSNKKTALLQIVEQFSVRKTLVFCNKIETCRKVENILKRIDRQGQKIRVLPFHAAVSQESRASNMKCFLDPQSEQSLFLICTDRASRGLDLINVDHVLLFDFPRDPSEYVRRVGRTARGAGGRGKAFVFVVGKQVSLAQRIIDRNEKGQPLHDLPSVL